jgi:sigma-B regulation protein RsbU (phosphoserine phosphatase)
MMPDTNYKWQRCELPPNSTLYLFSDGLYEVMQSNQQYIGLRRLSSTCWQLVKEKKM